ncbi:MAG: alpha/beta fold hydrolase [Acidobacteriota bacterium]
MTEPKPSTESFETVTFEATDGVQLEGTLYVPEAPRAALLVNSGTGIPRRFYGRFARAAADRGFAALTFDYRGIGGSAPASLRGYAARYRDWGQLDIPGAIDWLGARFDGLPLFALGHSTGGQQLGLASNVDRLRAAVFVAVSTGYWRGMPWAYGLFTLALWRAWLPVASRVYGRAPLGKLRFGEDLPVGVVREWAAWCLEPQYMAAYFDDGGHRRSPDGGAFGPTYFDRARFPIRAYYFTDDRISTPDNVPAMLSLYRDATVESLWIEPRQLGVGKVGHLGFFRSDIGAPLWDDAIEWLVAWL